MTRRPAVIFAVVCVDRRRGGLGAYLSTPAADCATQPESPPPRPRRRRAVRIQSAPAHAPPPAEAPAPTAAAAAPLRREAGARVRSARPAKCATLFFRHNGVDAHYGKVAWVDTRAHAPRRISWNRCSCEVVYVAGRPRHLPELPIAACSPPTAPACSMRELSRSRSTFPLKGIPSRARVSIDGSLAAFTVFVSGHGYTRSISPRKHCWWIRSTGAVLADLEDFEVRAGRRGRSRSRTSISGA